MSCRRYLCLFVYSGIQYVLTMEISVVVVLKDSGTAYPARAPGFIPGFLWDRVAHLFSFLCCVCLRLVCKMLPVSLDCPLLICPSDFSDIRHESQR